MKKKTAQPKRLTKREYLFVEAYMGKAQGNAAEAARLAGYAASRAAVTGCEMMKKPRILKEIEKRMAKHPLVLDRQRLQEFWSRIVQGEEKVEVILDKKKTGVELTPEMKDRLKASELLARSQALFTDNVKHDVSEELKEMYRKVTGG